jgi:hypothetical protein
MLYCDRWITSIVEEVVASLIWIEEHYHNSKNTTFQERGKTTGQDDAITSKERHFSPVVVILESRRVTLFH